MTTHTILIVSYIVFVWLVVLHTLEEIACGIMELKIGHLQLTRNRYLLAASALTTINLTVLMLIVLDIKAGYMLGLFTSAVLGVFQALVHTLGYLREGKKMRGLGVGFASSIPLAAAGVVVFVLLFRALLSQ